MSLPAFLLLTDTAENRTLCRARALSKRGAFVASGRGRRQAAEAGACSRSEHADSPRNASAQNRCDVIESQPVMRRINGIPNPRRIELYAGRGRKEKRLSDSDRDTLSQWQLKRKAHPGIRAQNGSRFPNDGPSGKCIPESRLKLGHTFRFTCRLKKPMRPPSQNWVEEGQNAIAGGQHDCRR